MKKKLLLGLICMSLCFSNTSIVFATGEVATWENASTESTTSQASDPEKVSVAEAKQKAARSKQKIESVLRELYPNESDLSIQVKTNALSDIVVSCESFGLSRAAIAGICANIYCESGFFPYAVENQNGVLDADLVFDMDATAPVLKANGQSIASLSGSNMQQARAQRTYTARATVNMPNLYDIDGTAGVGIGLIQSTDCQINKENPVERHLMNGLRGSQLYNVGMANSNDAFTCIYSFSNSFVYASPDDGKWNSSGKVTPKDTTYLFIPSTPIQMGILCCSLNEFGHASKVDEFTYEKGTEGYNGWDASEMTWEDFCNITDPWKAAMAFCSYCERNQGGWNSRYDAHSEAIHSIINLVCYNSVDFGSTTTVSTVGSEAEKLSYMTDLATSGFYTEDQLAHYVSMTETNIDMDLLSNAMRENLTSYELSELADWERNVETNSLEYIIIDGGRKILMVFAIALEVWSLLVYLAYWFDRLNNFIPISFLTILTFGKLRIADDTTKATYSLRENSTKTSVKTVNHRAMLGITCLGLCLGTLIMTGYLFVILEWVVMKAHNFFN